MSSILVVDDEPKIRKLFHRILEDFGRTILEAADGQEAVKTYAEHKPALVITDIVMPNKEGIETIINLKRINPDIKIIAMSGGGRVGAESYLAIAKRLGAAYTLEKPIDQGKLKAMVKDLLAEI
jgi:CheY-like chemotaxis protein